MSTPPPPPARLPPLLQPGVFRERLIVYLLPYFLALTDDFDCARAVVLETLASYGARTRSEMINAARIIAFSLTSLEVLAEAKMGDLSPELRMRYRGSATTLNRSCHQIEARFEKSLNRQPPSQPEAKAEPPSHHEAKAEPASQPEAEAEPADDMPETEFEAALQYAQAYLQTHRNRLPGAPPATLPPPVFASPQHPAMPPVASRDLPG